MQGRRSLLTLAFLLGAALALGACAGSAQPQAERNLSVTGSGSAFLTPDIVIVTLGVQSQGSNIGDTVAANNHAAEKVMQAISGLGVAKEDVQTTYFSVSTQPKYDEFGKPTNEVTYWVDNTVTVTLRDTSQLGKLLETALASGANSVQGVNYTVEHPDAALTDARSAAMADARRQAEQLAASAGLTLGEVLSVSESGPSNGPQFSASKGGGGGGSADQVPTAPGTLEYQVQVYVSFALR